MRLTVLAYLIFFSTFVQAQAGEKICLDRLANKELEIKYKLEPKTPPVNKQMAPFSFNTRWGSLNSSENFRGTSGYYCDAVDNHPAIYASSLGYTVVGSGYEKTFKLTELNTAFEAYRNLLKRTGYLE